MKTPTNEVGCVHKLLLFVIFDYSRDFVKYESKCAKMLILTSMVILTLTIFATLANFLASVC